VGTNGVAGVDTSVNDVGAGAGTSTGVVGVARGAVSVGDTRNTPGGTALGGVGVDGHDGILLDEFDLWNCQDSRPLQYSCSFERITHIGVVLESLDSGVIQSGSPALETLDIPDMVGLTLKQAHGISDRGSGNLVPELDKVLALNELDIAGSVDGSGLRAPGRGGQYQRQEREEGSGTHVGKLSR
jgi:hypothetical protein